MQSNRRYDGRRGDNADDTTQDVQQERVYASMRASYASNRVNSTGNVPRSFSSNRRSVNTSVQPDSSVSGDSNGDYPLSSADPLTPTSRLALDTRMEERETSSTSSTTTTTRPLSPHKALLDVLDSVNASNSTRSSLQSSFVSRSTSLYSSFGVNNGSHTASTLHNSDLSHKKTRGCSSAIHYNSLIRIRLSNRQCLRIYNNASSSSTTQDLRRNQSKKIKPAVTVDVSGNGLGGDKDQIFTLVNVNMRNDTGPVHYSHVVALYCIGGSARGRFLSCDPTTFTLTTKKGPVISNAEKWRLFNPDAPMDSSLDDLSSNNFFDNITKDHHSNAKQPHHVLYEQQKAIQTSAKVLFKTHTSGLLLSVPVNHLDRSKTNTVLLTKENDGLAETYQQVWEITKSNLPYDPQWNRERQFLTKAALCHPRKTREDHNSEDNDNDKDNVVAPQADEAHTASPLSSFPPSVQENLLLQDLLDVFLGYEGQYIKLQVEETLDTNATGNKRSHLKYLLPKRSVDPSLASLASRCFCLGEYYLTLARFIEEHSRYEYGLVSHAFCAALRLFVDEYMVVIVQLEHQYRVKGVKAHGKQGNEAFTLQKLWFYIQPSLRTMEMLYQLVLACENTLGGGALLTDIQQIQRSVAGDVNACKVFSFLLERASVPYLKMVERWIYHGDLVDPYDEFMVQQDDSLEKEELHEDPHSTYWQSRFTLRKSQVPLFLRRFATRILTTGKYLNVFRSCHQRMVYPNAGTVPFAESERVYEELIEQAHAYASQVLLKLFVDDHDLASRFVSLKHYFLMDQGDFFVDFMDVAEEELNLRADKLSLPRLESLLHLSLQGSTCASDPYKDDLVCRLSHQNLQSQMEAIHECSKRGVKDNLMSSASSMNQPGYKAIDAFTLDYRVQWPLSLVISSGALLKYQMLFRHLFFCKHVHRRLGQAWLFHQTTKEFHVRVALGKSFCLRQRMLHFQQNFVYYMTFEVISPRWHAFQKNLVGVRTVDEILTLHRDFLDICLKECLLTDSELLKVLMRLMKVCTSFADTIETFLRPYCLDDESIKAMRAQERDRRADKKAREEAELMMANYQAVAAGGKLKKKKSTLRRRQSSMVDLRRARNEGVSMDMGRALTQKDGKKENAFVELTSKNENDFDSLLKEFMDQLKHRSMLQYNTHLSHLCARLDYNGFYSETPYGEE